MNERGVFITIMIFMLLSVMLSLAAIGRYYEVSAESNLSGIGVGSRVFYRFQNIKDVLFYILEKIAMPEYSVEDTGIYFSDTLPVVNSNFNTNKQSALASNATNFKKFLELYGDDLNVNLDFSSGNFMGLVIEPYNIEYYYPSGQSGRAIGIDPNGVDIGGYDLNVLILNQDFNQVVWQNPSSPATIPSPGYDKFVLTIYEDTYSNLKFSQTYYLDPTVQNKGYIDTDQQGANDISFRVTNGAVLRIVGSNTIDADLKTGVLTEGLDMNYVDIRFLLGTFSVSEDTYGYSKTE